jgi:hypothetical protein
MNEQIPLSPESLADNPSADERRDDNTREILSDVAYKRLAIVNVVYFGKANAGDGAWVLIDAGVAGQLESSDARQKSASARTPGPQQSSLRTGISITPARSRRSRSNGTCRSTRTSLSCPT